MGGAPETRLPVRRPAPAVRHRDRGRRARQRGLHAAVDALLPRGHPAEPAPGRAGDLDRVRRSRCPPGPLIGALVDRLGAKQVLLAGNAAPGGRLLRLPGRRLVRGRAVLDDRGDPRPHRLLGLLRQHRHRHLAAGGAGAVVRLPRRAAQRRLRGRRARLGRGDLDRHRPGVRASWSPSTRRRTSSPSGCCSPCPTRARPAPRAACRAPGATVLRDRPYRLLVVAQVGYSLPMMILNFALPVYAVTVLGLPGWVTGVVFTVNCLMVGFGQGLVVNAADRARPLPGPAADPGGLRRVVRRVPRRQRLSVVVATRRDRARRDRLHARPSSPAARCWRPPRRRRRRTTCAAATCR